MLSLVLAITSPFIIILLNKNRNKRCILFCFSDLIWSTLCLHFLSEFKLSSENPNPTFGITFEHPQLWLSLWVLKAARYWTHIKSYPRWYILSPTISSVACFQWFHLYYYFENYQRCVMHVLIMYYKNKSLMPKLVFCD